ncbi:hypothetical protein T439DRAFT_368338, partial [Meredithblackwellia eburnea MCA 4105]
LLLAREPRLSSPTRHPIHPLPCYIKSLLFISSRPKVITAMLLALAQTAVLATAILANSVQSTTTVNQGSIRPTYDYRIQWSSEFCTNESLLKWGYCMVWCGGSDMVKSGGAQQKVQLNKGLTFQQTSLPKNSAQSGTTNARAVSVLESAIGCRPYVAELDTASKYAIDCVFNQPGPLIYAWCGAVIASSPGEYYDFVIIVNGLDSKCDEICPRFLRQSAIPQDRSSSGRISTRCRPSQS